MVKRSSSVATVSAIPRLRQGEGALINAIRHDLPHPDGTKSTAVGIDLGTAPVPDRKYAADVAAVIEADDGIRLVFAQRRLDKGLRSLVVVHISVDALRNFSRSVVGLLDGLKAHGQLCGPKDLPLTDIREEPTQAVAFNANFIVCGYAASEATMDFMLSSAFVLDHIVRSAGSQIAVEPIVRVTLPSRLMFNVLDQAVALSRKMGLHEEQQL